MDLQVLYWIAGIAVNAVIILIHLWRAGRSWEERMARLEERMAALERYVELMYHNIVAHKPRQK